MTDPDVLAVLKECERLLFPYMSATPVYAEAINRLTACIRALEAKETKETDKGFDEATETRWQTAIYEFIKKLAPRPGDIDGSGCDSGDALDVTLAEIRELSTQLVESKERDERSLAEMVLDYENDYENGLVSGSFDRREAIRGRLFTKARALTAKPEEEIKR
jgi:hypothetical protein